MMFMLSSSSSLLCDACGLPPKLNQRLRKCTRCGSVQYHDATCQKKHYPQHKTICRRKAAASEMKRAALSAATATTEPLVACKRLKGRGRALIATTELHAGCRPLTRVEKIISNEVNREGGEGLCAPIVPPTLKESMRASRCSYCFRKLAYLEMLGRNSSSNLLHVHCSIECRNLDQFWKKEEHASVKLISTGRISSLPSPTALTCCRILQLSLKNPKVLDEYNELCYKDDDDDFKTEQGDARLKIMMQCHQLLLAMGVTPAVKLAHDLLDPDPILALRFISRLALNGFTICSSEQETLGVGVYPRASMINHSCRPNAVQTFFLSEGHVRRSHPPMLQITMCRDADIGEEITIGYCDVSPPLYDRRKALKNYNFLCDCKFCQDIKRGDALIGLRCTAVDIKCEGRVRSSPTDVPNSYEMIENRHYCCDSCGHSDFENSLKTISQLMTRIEAIESKLKDDSVNSNNKYTRRVGEELKQQFDSMLKYCNPQTSWFITRSSDVFINWCANALNYYPKGEEQLSLCHQALSVLNKSRMATKFCYDYEGSLAWLLKRGIEAKFRLFINPMDMEALSIMREVKRDLIRYYPSTDEIVLSLDESIRVYSNS